MSLSQSFKAIIMGNYVFRAGFIYINISLLIPFFGMSGIIPPLDKG